MRDINYRFLLDDVAWVIVTDTNSPSAYDIHTQHSSSLFIPSALTTLIQVVNDRKGGRGVRSWCEHRWRLAWKEQSWRGWWCSIQCCVWATKGLVERVGERDERQGIKRQGGLFMSIRSRCMPSPMQPLSHEPMGSSAPLLLYYPIDKHTRHRYRRDEIRSISEACSYLRLSVKLLTDMVGWEW